MMGNPAPILTTSEIAKLVGLRPRRVVDLWRSGDNKLKHERSRDEKPAHTPSRRVFAG